jgi:hypothetical protein
METAVDSLWRKHNVRYRLTTRIIRKIFFLERIHYTPIAYTAKLSGWYVSTMAGLRGHDWKVVHLYKSLVPQIQ